MKVLESIFFVTIFKVSKVFYERIKQAVKTTLMVLQSGFITQPPFTYSKLTETLEELKH